MKNRFVRFNTPSWAIIWSLRIVIAIQCVGIAGRYVLSTIESESDIYSYLFFDFGWPENLAQTLDDVGAFGCLIAAMALIANGFVSSKATKEQASRRISVSRFVDVSALLFVAIWTFTLAFAHSVRGELFAELALGEQAVRFTTPIVMLLLLGGLERSSRKLAYFAICLLTVATVTTFVVHGYKAIQSYGAFTDLILLTDQRLLHFEFRQATAEKLLLVIGWADIIVAALLLVTRWRVIAVYLMLWGLITAASRMTAFGMNAWPDTLIRAANAGAPLVLLLLYQRFTPAEELS